MRVLLLLIATLVPLSAFAQQAASPQIMIDVKARDFTGAAALAQATGDPLMVKLVTFFRLTSGGGGTADETQQFIANNPDWPYQARLAFNLAQANGVPHIKTSPTDVPFLAQAQTLHATGNDTQAAALWASQGKAAAAQADDAGKLLFWPAQNQLARALLMQGNAKDAYAVVIAVNPPISGSSARSQIADRDFLAGFLLLRFLHNPTAAATWFTDLASSSTAVITQARAYYWLARCETGDAAKADDQRAAAYPTTYYGQLAALALGEDPAALAAQINNVQEPGFTAGQALNFAMMELPRAAALLVQMNDPDDAQIFLNRLGQTAADDRTRELAAQLALGLGLPQSAVAIARSAGIAGQILVHEGWPRPVAPPSSVDPAVSLGIMRQESSFDSTAVSGAGARGLMQLMPATARKTAKQNGLPINGDLYDPNFNMALGVAYINQLILSFGNCLPLAIAAYNAGPTNVANWLAENGDPEMKSAPGGANIIDWIEEIPFSETRNYVQRVTESVVIYRAMQTGRAEDPLTAWMTP
ncbi:MAG: lytic transglycosylase domain-containing protein [Acidocella sp.]|nr:lytic transglycosylase domain-containing protein [Acidocella sp.]